MIDNGRMHEGWWRGRFGTFAPYLLLAAATVLLVAGIWASVQARTLSEERYSTSKSFDRANSAVRSLEQYTIRTLKAAENITRMAAVSLSYNSPEETIERARKTGIIDGSMFQSLIIQDSNGDLVSTTIDRAPGLNYADREYFKTAKNSGSDDIIVGSPVYSRLTGQPTIPIARRFNDKEGNFGGVVLVQVRTEAFEQGFRELDLEGMDYAALIGLDGIVRAGVVGDASMHGREVSSSNVFLREKEAPAGTFSAPAKSDGVFRHVAYRTLEDYPLFVAFGVDAGRAAEEFTRRRSEFVMAGAATTAIVVLFAGGLFYILRRKDEINASLRANEESLRSLAATDFLTGLPNRRTLEAVAADEIGKAAADGSKVICIFIDLDNLGEINSALGHQVGDQVLKEAAEALAAHIPQGGHISRAGGDEFIIIHRSSGDVEAMALKLADRLREATSTVRVAGGLRVNLQASIGISLYPSHASSLTALVRCADDAMAQSKTGRRGLPVMFSPSMGRLAERSLAIRSELEDALNNGALEVHYQPKVDLHTRRPIGVEALLRWRHPNRGMIPATEFIPIAEASGLVVLIGAWVLKRACNDCALLHSEGFDELTMAVNVSALQFRQPDLTATVLEALQSASMRPQMLELELTESMVADDPEATAAVLSALKEVGVSLAIDDFGTGY